MTQNNSTELLGYSFHNINSSDDPPNPLDSKSANFPRIFGELPRMFRELSANVLRISANVPRIFAGNSYFPARVSRVEPQSFENLIAVYANTSTVIQSHSDVYPRQRDPFTEVLTEHLRFHVRACAEPHCKDVIGPAKKATESPRACIAFLVVLIILLPN